MFDDINDLYQQVILDHCKKPRNFHEMPSASRMAQGHNPLCGDNLKLYLDMDGDGALDVVLTSNGGPARLFRNDNRTGNQAADY